MDHIHKYLTLFLNLRRPKHTLWCEQFLYILYIIYYAKYIKYFLRIYVLLCILFIEWVFFFFALDRFSSSFPVC